MTKLHRKTLFTLAATAALCLCVSAAIAYEGFDPNKDPTQVTEATVKAHRALRPGADVTDGALHVSDAAAHSHNTQKTLHSHQTAMKAHPIASTD